MQHGPRHAEEMTPGRSAPLRTCVGCGVRAEVTAMVRVIEADGEIAFDLAGGAFGRGAHLHARPACLERAARGLSRSLRRAIDADAGALATSLVQACERRMAGLLLAAHRRGVLATGASAAIEALADRTVLVVIASDAGTIASHAEVARCVAEGRAIAWSTKGDLGALLGCAAVAICAVRHAAIAAELKKTRAAADAGVATRQTARTEGARCSRRPEAR